MIRLCTAGLLGLLLACGNDRPPADRAPEPPARAEPSRANRAPEPPAQAEPSPPEEEETPVQDDTPAQGQTSPAAESRACARVLVGLDLRALPTGTAPEHVELFVRGEGSDLAGAAGPGPRPTVRSWPGTGALEAVFAARTEPAAVRRCQEAVRSYLPSAPRRAGTRDPAAQVTEECAPSRCP